jgi:hypothetical protein
MQRRSVWESLNDLRELKVARVERFIEDGS